MLTHPDPRRLHYRRHRPLPDREGILSPLLSRHTCRGKAGGNYPWMGNCHPSACFARRPELEPSQSAGGLRVVWHGIVRDRNNLPLPLPHREGKKVHTRPTPRLCRGIAGGNYPWMENRHPAACFARRPELEPSQSVGGLHVVWHGTVRDRNNLPQPLPHREGKKRHTRPTPRLCRGIAGGNYLRMGNCHPSACFARRPELEPSQSAGGLRVVWHGIVRDRNNLPLPLPHREGKKVHTRPTPRLCRGIAGGNYPWMGKRHPAACFARRPELEPFRSTGGFHPMPQGEASGNFAHAFPFVSARMLLPYGITGLWHRTIRDRGNLPLPLPHREGKKPPQPLPHREGKTIART